MSDVQARQLSVVVPSVNGWQDLNGCLAALERERVATPLEVLLPERCGAGVRTSLAQAYPWVRVFPVSPKTTIPAMRALAFMEATAPTVAVIEDHVIVPGGWARQMVRARTSEARVIGGGIVNGATARVVDWAAFLCEYSQAVGPVSPGPAAWLTGNNTAYDRALLIEFQKVIAAGRWEDVLHEAFRQHGIVLWSRPDIVAQHTKHYTVGGYLSQRYHFARAYAGAGQKTAAPIRRVLRGLLSLALPPVLLGRIILRTWRGGTHRAQLIRSLPLLAVFVSAWSVGEAVGCWFGEGNSLAKVA